MEVMLAGLLAATLGTAIVLFRRRALVLPDQWPLNGSPLIPAPRKEDLQ